MTTMNGFPPLDRRDAVPVRPGPHVLPQRIGAPAVFTMHWPEERPDGTRVRFTDEMIADHIGREIRVNYGEGFSYQARIAAMTRVEGGVDLTLERVEEQKD